MQVLDYSAGFPGAAAIKAAGYDGAVRYIGFPDRRKCTNAAELADFTAHGLGMALVYEDHADDWRGGYAAGAAAARRGRAHADAIGFPRQRPLYMAIDRDVVTEGEFRVAMDYLRGAGSVLGPEWVGDYGEHDVVARAAAEGVARWHWQCRAWSGVPQPRLFGGRHLYQRVGTVRVGGIDCDINDVLTADWGQHTMEVDDLSAEDLLNTEIEVRDADGSVAKTASVRQILEWTDNRTASVLARLDALEERLDQLTVGDIDPKKLADALAGPLGDHVRQALGAEVYNALLRVVTNTRLTVPGSGGL